MFEAEHDDFRAAFRAFLDREAVPRSDVWEEQGHVDKSFWRKAGEAGYLAFEAPESFGGLGVRDFRFNAVIAEEVVASGMAGDGFALHNDIVAPYLLEHTSQEQLQRWLPGVVRGETVTAIAMSEPGAGSDLARISTTARREGDTLVLNGSKTFITNGYTADLVLVLARGRGEDDTDTGMNLVAVESGTPGFQQAKPLKKVGRRAQDTAELHFDDCRVPASHVIGPPGRAFDLVKQNLPRERLSIAITAVASARRGLALALAHADTRRTFGKPLRSHQTVLHRLADMHTRTQVAQSHIDACVLALNAGELTPEDAAGAKYYATDLEGAVLDEALQLFGGYGYMEEYPIARMWRDARVQRIYGGANDILKEVVGRGLFA
jgi:acyl-CoA dehydrogenase